MYTELELTLRGTDTTNGLADLAFQPSGSHSRVDLVRGAPVSIDLEKLLLANAQESEYGEALGEMLFSDPKLLSRWNEAHAYTQGAAKDTAVAMRFRLRLDSPFLGLHWEKLRIPGSDTELCRGERVLLSRYFDSDDLMPIRIPERPDFRASVVVAAPSNLSDYHLVDIDVAGDVASYVEALEGAEVDVVAHAANGRRATLDAVARSVRGGSSVLILECHGTFNDANTASVLFLEDEEGRADLVKDHEFVRRISNLATKPLLIILASCDTAGSAGAVESAARAVGPSLVACGVPAVIGMQGYVLLRTVQQLLPRFFRELMMDGQVDRALAVARSEVADEPDWWAPALFMRVRDGCIWRDESAAMPTASTEVAGQRVPPPRSTGERLLELRELLEAELITEGDYYRTKQRILDAL